MKKSLNDLIKVVTEFGIERSWDNNDPNQLITSTLIELGELSEHFQWTSKFKEYDEEKRLEISYELVDVLFYLFRIAGKCNIDLDKAFETKVEKLKIKYPIGSDYQKQKELYRKTGMNKTYEEKK